MKRVVGMLSAAAVLLSTPFSGVQAQSDGYDFWVEMFKSQGLYQPHANNCSASEAFIPVYTGATVGFCMELNERTSATFSLARATCAALGKRLPEPVEFKVACETASTGLQNMTNNYEWGTNLPKMYKTESWGAYQATIVGGGACAVVNRGVVGYETGYGLSEQSFGYRCVR